jgi:hypothetical protein
MLDLTVTVENGQLIVGRLQLMGEAAKAFGGHSVRVGSALIYAPYVVGGTRAHTILPRTKQALFWPGAAHPVRSVQHPGTKPNPFMTDALTEVGPQIEERIVSHFEEVANGGGGNYTQILAGAGLILQAQIQRNSPVKTGGLRASYHTEVS